MGNWLELVSAARTASIPAPALRAVTLGQWMLESGHGASKLAELHNNFAGLKYRKELSGIAEKIHYQANDGADDYCGFSSPSTFIDGYWAFIGRSVYAGWETFANDPAGYIGFLKAKGYSTDPDYQKHVLACLPAAQALLTQIPAAAVLAATAPPVAASAPGEVDRPSRSKLGEQVSDRLGPADLPRFVAVPEVTHKFQGLRPNGLEGAIVHYDAGRTRSSNAPADLDWAARNTLVGAQANDYAFVTISRKGTIFLPNNMAWDKWGYHAGESLCPATKRTGVSRFYVGFEINSPGLVFPTEDADLFVPWFDAVADAKGNVILDSKGRATVRNAKGELYHAADLHHVLAPAGNMKPGYYVPYTQAQTTALISALLWLKRCYPKSFRLEYVFGHDEVAPHRKSDPGGSLGDVDGVPPGAPMSMAKFRATLLGAWAVQLKITAD